MSGKKNFSGVWLVAFVALVWLASSAADGKTIYVDADAPGPTHDGTSWFTAFKYLQDGLAAALNGDEIRTAEGVYKPDRGAGVTSGDRDASFRLKNGVAIRGGYAGLGWPDPNARDIGLYRTVLSGDLAGNDGIDFSGNGENSYHVVAGSIIDGSAILEGLTIMRGNANVATSNRDSGGGLYNYYSSPTVTDCRFRENKATYGGGMFNDYFSDPCVSNCEFTTNGASYGGGLANYQESNPVVSDCIFNANTAGGDGGAVYCEESAPQLRNVTISMNLAGSEGGGMYSVSSSPSLINVTFDRNYAYSGGGIHSRTSDLILTNTTFRENTALYSGGYGAGMYSYNDSATFSNCLFAGNVAYGRGGGLYKSNSYSGSTSAQVTVLLTGCTFSNNLARDDGGGIYNTSGYSSTVSGAVTTWLANCSFFGNTSHNRAGGIYNYNNANSYCDMTTLLVNCAFSGNSANGSGGAVYSQTYKPYSSLEVANCTFNENKTFRDGGGIRNESGETTLTNCIFWANAAEYGPQMSVKNTTLSVSYCDVQDSNAAIYNLGGSTINWDANSNIDADPLFADADGPDYVVGTEDDNLRLLAGSPCLDAADNNSVPPDTYDLDGDGNTVEPIPWDLDQNPRFFDDPCAPDSGNGTPPIVDMGAYERGPGVCGDSGHPHLIGDMNRDCLINFKDFALLGDRWLACTLPQCD